ncbi:MAG: DNA mismatch repair endonuclease MutL, partial [bacterium]|nr:DNA mismatch repair endonuclease MutL [bacterium]
MSSPIQVLPDSLITKIAAGEVVERPASVVKELVENSLDSGATEITVQMEQGGRDSLFVADNGSGMNAEDLRMAIQRHATSKIKKEEDLFQIQTLGFRGEALAAIASISFLRIESRKKGEETGSFIELEGGKVVKEGKISIPIGTRIFIRQLFFNTPARLKFLKNPETEGNHILDLIQSYALISPKIAFHLKQNQKEEIEVRAGETFEERVCSLFGEQVSKSLLPYEGAVSQIKAAGFCSSPGLTSGTRRSLFFFVNGRLVKDRVLQHAVLSAYESLLMKGRFPWVILYLEIPYQYVDVNVHPTKAEVRFTNGSVVHDAVRGVIRKKLGSLNEGVGAALQHYVPNPSQPPLTSRG